MNSRLTDMVDVPERWILLTYKVPSQSSRARVAVWREVKRLGAFYVQQAACVLPDRPGVAESVAAVRARIEELGGSSFVGVITEMTDADRQHVAEGLLEASEKDYDEILEECDTKFVKEIEFEHFRENYTFEESEEIRQDLEKLRRWFERVVSRDWMEAPGRAACEKRIAECEELLEEFEAEVYRRTQPTEA